MRTTIRISSGLHSEARKLAALANQSFTSFVEDALRGWIDRRQLNPGIRDLKLTTVKGAGLQPGIDLDNSATIFELMDHSNVPF